MTAKKGSRSIFKELSLEVIDRPDDIVRLEINQDEISELAASILERGLLQPISVTPRKDRFMIVFGDRRYLAHELLARKKIMCIIEERNDKEVALDRAMENTQRVNLTPFEEGHIYYGLMTKAEMGLKEICKRMGKSAGVIQRKMDILKMPESFQKALHRLDIGISVAEELWRCPDEAKREYFLELAIEHGITRDVARLWVDDERKRVRGKESASNEGGGEVPPYVEKPVYGTCDICHDPAEYKDIFQLGICKTCKDGIDSVIKDIKK